MTYNTHYELCGDLSYIWVIAKLTINKKAHAQAGFSGWVGMMK